MTDPLPADVRAFLHLEASNLSGEAMHLLKKYPDPPPAPTPNTQEQNIAFRKAWDELVARGQQ